MCNLENFSLDQSAATFGGRGGGLARVAMSNQPRSQPAAAAAIKPLPLSPPTPPHCRSQHHLCVLFLGTAHKRSEIKGNAVRLHTAHTHTHTALHWLSRCREVLLCKGSMTQEPAGSESDVGENNRKHETGLKRNQCQIF